MVPGRNFGDALSENPTNKGQKSLRRPEMPGTSVLLACDWGWGTHLPLGGGSIIPQADALVAHTHPHKIMAIGGVGSF